MIAHILAGLSLAILTLASTLLWQGSTPLVNASSDPVSELPYTQPVVTQTKFSEKTETVDEVIPRKEVTKDDPDSEVGDDKVIDEGADGKKTKTYKITYYLNEEYSRELVSTDITQAKDKITSKGTKIIWRTLDTADGTIQYWKKIHVYATHYDSHCPGCNDWTAIGMRAGKGVIAVDPKVIKLRSKVYVPGYGLAVAGDTGGAVKGNIIDLGFEDAHTAGWSARFVDIYLL